MELGIRFIDTSIFPKNRHRVTFFARTFRTVPVVLVRGRKDRSTGLAEKLQRFASRTSGFGLQASKGGVYLNYVVDAMTIKDYEAVTALWRSTEGIGLSEADSRDNIRSYLERNPGLSSVARQGGEVVGALLCGHDGRRGFLHHLAVQEEHRRLGLGRMLVEMSLRHLAQAGIMKCHLFVFQENEAAKGFWQKLGWNRRLDIGIMSKNI